AAVSTQNRRAVMPILLLLVTFSAEPPFYKDRSALLVYLDGKGKPVPVKSPADWQKRRDHVLASMQLVMGPLPPDSRKVPLDIEVEGEQALPRVIRKKITFAVEKGGRVS